MKKKGFTLVELLAVISIMAILLLLILPSINRLQNQNHQEQFELYAQSAMKAAKLYVEDKKEELKGYSCVSLSYSLLTEADLLKPYSNPRYNCTNLEVRAYKSENNTLTFAYRLTCLDTKKGNQEVFNQSTLKAGGCYTRTVV